ncbi:MAG: aldehyde dehydrogenase family protein [Conexivisphaerales archaeon]|nr:aldehyde dehydrogenase family protein [Conexivisphaerales archaeon]
MDKRIPVYEPATGKILDYVQDMTDEDVKAAIERAYASLESLQTMSAHERARALRKVAEKIRNRKEELAVLLSREIGRPIKSSRLVMERTASIYELAAQELPQVLTGDFVPLEAYNYPAGNEKRIAIVKREPVGVVGAITPFNFPPDSMAHKVAPALAIGNAVVLKPSKEAPLTEIAISEIIKDSGFPESSLEVVTGNSEMIGNLMIDSEKVSLISFTGSSKVGLELAGKAIVKGKKVIMELGGSDAAIVLEDSDLDVAARAVTVGRFDYAGQFCNATKRVIVREEVYEEFVKRLVDNVKKLNVGDPLSESTDIGPLINIEAVEKMKSFVNDALNVGGKIIYQYPKSFDKGFYYPPTIIEAPLVARVWNEEVFGPVLPLIKVKNDDEALRIANNTEYGLDASVFTKDFSRAYRLASKIKAGSVIINDMTRVRFDNLPFGGVKKSGIGREGVKYTMLEMSETKIIAYNLG